VELLGAHGEAIADASLWGIESTGEYWRDVAADLAADILYERATAWRAALREARERAYWIARGVLTLRNGARVAYV